MRKLKSNLDHAGARILGVVLNNINTKDSTIIGYQAAQNALSGSCNTYIGAQIAQNLQSGDFEITVRFPMSDSFESVEKFKSLMTGVVDDLL